MLNVETLQRWNVAEFQGWNVEMLKRWNVECWNSSTLKCWRISRLNVEILNVETLNLEMLKYFHVEMLNYNVEILKNFKIVAWKHTNSLNPWIFVRQLVLWSGKDMLLPLLLLLLRIIPIAQHQKSNLRSCLCIILHHTHKARSTI